jgi:hypothetical protein
MVRGMNIPFCRCARVSVFPDRKIGQTTAALNGGSTPGTLQARPAGVHPSILFRSLFDSAMSGEGGLPRRSGRYFCLILLGRQAGIPQ